MQSLKMVGNVVSGNIPGVKHLGYKGEVVGCRGDVSNVRRVGYQELAYTMAVRNVMCLALAFWLLSFERSLSKVFKCNLLLFAIIFLLKLEFLQASSQRSELHTQTSTANNKITCFRMRRNFINY
ncbi:hypothetical protein VNO78_03067 [Psophocarpus tetragonolobus]|uniref:Uncharacterized protein n=1 Tax=Psophocarpus tetragonolobus TaxID=3891 RepID=A0AAN9XWA3_PSOTE